MPDIEKNNDNQQLNEPKEELVFAPEEEINFEEQSPKLSEKDEMMMDLMSKFPQFASLPPKGVIITSFLVFVFGIVGVIIGLAVPAFNIATKVIIVSSSVLIVLVYSFIYKNFQNKKIRQINAYAYDFYDILVNEYKVGKLQEYLRSGLEDVMKEDIFTEMELDSKSNAMWACGSLSNDRELTILFDRLSVDITIEDESRIDDAHFNLLDNIRNDVEGDTRYGYARKSTIELYDDVIEMIKFKMNLTNSEDEEF